MNFTNPTSQEPTLQEALAEIVQLRARLAKCVEASTPLLAAWKQLANDPEGMTFENAYYLLAKPYKLWRALEAALDAEIER